jgi:hypothetical protein
MQAMSDESALAERRAIVEWLRDPPGVMWSGEILAKLIENGAHLANQGDER